VAVLELFGEVSHAEWSTRLDGVMVVDRMGGVLLQLELRSGQAQFSLQRELLKVEAAAP
jgi:hypothetical protein